MSLEADITLKLEEILVILKRIEARQIVVKKEIEAEPVVGSFASTESPKEK